LTPTCSGGFGQRSGKEGFAGAGLKDMVEKYVGFEQMTRSRDDPGYDSLDIFINRLFFFEAIPPQTKDLERNGILSENAGQNRFSTSLRRLILAKTTSLSI